MKYSLLDNALSSLNIAIENFKLMYYHNQNLSKSRVDEATKICIIFLENSIELFLKSILVTKDPTSIYLRSSNAQIQNILNNKNEEEKLEDLLLYYDNIKTISYTCATKKYIKLFNPPKKFETVLSNLGKFRNAITHFGIDKSNNQDECLICIINTFDIIYNYLYPQLIKLESVGKYFVSDDIIVETIHGLCPLFDNETFIYNNIIDFLDELMETSKDYICCLRARNPESLIMDFSMCLKEVIEDQDFQNLIKEYGIQLTSNCNYIDNDYYFEVNKEYQALDIFYSNYSPFFNVTAFCGEIGNIYFLVKHQTHKLYIYNQISIWPQPDEPEPDEQWEADLHKGFCECYDLNRDNLLFAFRTIFSKII